MRCVIFDLDGTLADTSGDLIAAANACFDAMGESVRLDPDRDAGIALRGGRRMLTEGLTRAGRFSDAAVAKWYPELLSAYGAAISLHTRLYPGAIEAVETLRRDGYAVAICTNKPEALAESLLRDLGIRALFGALVGADSLEVAKPHAAPYIAAVQGCGGTVAQSLLVGDSDTDRITAANAGVASVLVTFSPAGQSVRDLAPEAVIDHFDELPAVAARLLAPTA